MNSRSASNAATRGYVIPIGGGESRRRNPTILRRFVEICGDSKARIAVIPTASKRSDTGQRYERDARPDWCVRSILARGKTPDQHRSLDRRPDSRQHDITRAGDPR